jgi:hypothetical protein
MAWSLPHILGEGPNCGPYTMGGDMAAPEPRSFGNEVRVFGSETDGVACAVKPGETAKTPTNISLSGQNGSVPVTCETLIHGIS